MLEMKNWFMRFATFILAVSMALYACTAPKATQKVAAKTVTVTPAASEPQTPPPAQPAPISADFKPLSTMPTELPTYQATTKRETDIIHTKLDVRFDWAKRYLYGKATITAKPYFYPSDSMVLDAKGFEIKQIQLVDGGRNSTLKYDYNAEKLLIHLPRTYRRDENYTVFIEYTAKPEEAYAGGGSAAITSDKGLFFINPDGKELDKPTQIWTQGETQSNSRWMPTVDRPNERMTDEIYMTVESKYKTLSNGILADSKNNADGTRTDHWKMDLPHAPYLVMMAVGEFAVVTEKWNGIDVMYYVEPKYESAAKVIFKDTPEMLSFFSEKLGVKYPWQKFAQVVVRDYVSGAMENTTAVIFGEYMNGTARELIDKDYNAVVVPHEMFHHWFGDLVTCESWSNLTVNESFADFSESLWLEHKYGADAGEHHRHEALQQYLEEAQTKTHPLVHWGYKNREEMFDRHSYNKGGLILQMLRRYVGEDAFFASLKKYLTDNQFNTGEAHQLRLAFEATTGEDLSWFFNQWYFHAGHPVLNISYEYDEAAKKMNVTVEQTQMATEETPAIFELPMGVDIYTAVGQVKHENIRVTERKQVFTFDAATRPMLVNVETDKTLVCEKTDNHSEAEWIFMYKNAPRYLDRLEALEALKNTNSTQVESIYEVALNDKFYTIREDAVQNIKIKENPKVLETIAQLAVNDTRSTVRAASVAKLAAAKDAKWIPTFKSVLEKEQAYPVLASAMNALYKLEPTEGLALAKKMESETNDEILAGVGDIYSSNADATQIPFFEKNLDKVDGMSSIGFIGNYIKVLTKTNATDEQLVEKTKRLQTIALNQAQSPWKRFAATKAISDVRKKMGTANANYKTLTDALLEIKDKETNDQLKSVYENIVK